MIYQASKDGFGAKDFHGKCDGKDKTLTIIKTTNNFIFGGYTEASWSSLKQWINDPKAFIFSLVNSSKTKIKINNSESSHAIYGGSDCGPSFGRGCDIYISNDSNKNSQSYSNLCHTYQHPQYTNGSNEANNFLAGSYNFQTSEIEVYQKL